MSKAVMLSIRPKWCEKIINGDKTIEVRKTRPKLETPFKCYIYCTKAEVVTRCKDCKHYRNRPNGLCYLHTEPKANARGYSGDAVCVEPDDFCSYGEPKEG